MKQLAFEPGEEKLEEAFNLIGSLQKVVLTLSQRSEVDSIVISLLLDDLADPAAALARWKAKTGEYYSDRALDHLGNAGMEMPYEELKRRLDLWTRALQARAGAGE